MPRRLPARGYSRQIERKIAEYFIIFFSFLKLGRVGDRGLRKILVSFKALCELFQHLSFLHLLVIITFSISLVGVLPGK
jgi:hypothetical protein